MWHHKVRRYLKYYPPDLAKLATLIRQESGLWKNTQHPAYRRHFIEQTYLNLIGTRPQADEHQFYVDLWQKWHLTPFKLLASFLMMPRRFEQQLYGTTGIDSHHQARLQLVQTRLPEAKRILDLGGSAAQSALGSLLAMGYPYSPESIDIVDLPPEQRHYHRLQIQHPTQFITETGINITYHYRSMADLDAFPSRHFDMIWSGQSFEHVSEADGQRILAAARRLLTPGGYFCLDTPNRLISRLQAHEDWLHPEHQIEYTPLQLQDLLHSAGFRILEQGAVSPMPFTVRNQRFSRLELIAATGLGPHSELGYSCFMIAQNPSGC